MIAKFYYRESKLDDLVTLWVYLRLFTVGYQAISQILAQNEVEFFRKGVLD